MATPNITIPANIEDYTLSASLNASMLYNFLMGIYTIVYGGTVYIYLSKRPLNTSHHVVLTSISVLYILAFVAFILQWHFLKWSFIVNGQTRESMFRASLEYPLWCDAMSSFLQNLTLVISDGLLIWRSYHVWGQSMKVTAILSVLFVAELGLSIADAALNGLIPYFTSLAESGLVHNIGTALIFVSLGTTLSATFLIGYRIHTASENVRQLRTRYNRIVSTVAESSAVYLLVLLLDAMTLVIHPFYAIESPLSEAQYYIDVTLFTVAGLAPTVMVLRLALTKPTNTVSSGTITHVSVMDFNNSQLGGGASASANTSGKEASPFANFKSDKEDQTPIIHLMKESTSHNFIGESPV